MSRIDRLDLTQLRVMQALLKERNISRVAGQMGLTQQAVSERVRKLRDIFNDRLFLRTSNGMTPTPFAESLQSKINHILEEVDELIAPQEFEPGKLTGRYTISANDYAVQVVLPPLLAHMREQAPELKILVRDFEWDNLHSQLATGELDLALSFPAFTPQSCHNLLLFEEHHVCVAAKDSPLQQQNLSVSDIAALPQLVISPSRANLKGSADDWFAEQGYKRNIVMSVPSFAAAPDVIASTGCVAFLPSRLLPHPKVKPLNTRVRPPHFEVIAAWHPRSHYHPLHLWVLELLKRAFAQDG
ncbi:LysR family transcriptional regulator [Endozoicomonas gorgoniicola]|uniref:LysR family transcriptional regulator n=1 Tax=Endozoicomonas gorgoniicola TaxID=1234144 RepID=A0ABT3MSU8_9GAMM|nr:LysR family transcriptional regulator [Endozoicomonas gorgoniicola]MCW7552461.1 LysR family transcriptional regulator [Endozoicomonas gorgoniicola]